VALAYFYFSFNDEQKQTANGMIESIIKQICCCRPDTPPSVKDLEDLKVRGQRADARLLRRVLIETLRGFSSVYVVIDALDECPESDPEHGREALLRCLAAINEGRSSNMHMLWTSRREKDIEASYQALRSRSEKWDIDLSLYKPAVDHDIGIFVDTTLSSLEYGSWPKKLKDEAREALIERADGMYVLLLPLGVDKRAKNSNLILGFSTYLVNSKHFGNSNSPKRSNKHCVPCPKD